VSFFEDIRVGDVLGTGRYTFTTENIKSFACRFDPQPFHIDEAAGQESHFGALAASGWQTATVWMRLMLDQRRAAEEAARARGERVAQMGPALGLRDLRWLKPVYVGDTLDYRGEIVEMRVSNSRPGFGLVTIRTTATNQHGEPVLSFMSTTFVERRPQS
jgi:acyl dehydratase